MTPEEIKVGNIEDILTKNYKDNIGNKKFQRKVDPNGNVYLCTDDTDSYKSQIDDPFPKWLV